MCSLGIRRSLRCFRLALHRREDLEIQVPSDVRSENEDSLIRASGRLQQSTCVCGEFPVRMREAKRVELLR